jgi:hypothetical protein
MEEYYPVIRGLVWSSWIVARKVFFLFLFFGIIFIPTIVHSNFVDNLERNCDWNHQCSLTEASREKFNVSMRWAAAVLSILALISSVRLPWDCQSCRLDRHHEDNSEVWRRNPLECNALLSPVHLLLSIVLWGTAIFFMVLLNKADSSTWAISFIPLFVYIAGSLSWWVEHEYEKYLVNNPMPGQTTLIDPSNTVVDLETAVDSKPTQI